MSIQRYLEQLIEEIDEKMNIPLPGSIRELKEQGFFFESDDLDERMEFHSIPLTRYSNILKESLPPPEKLSLKQSKMLVEKIYNLLENWNFHLEYPETTPIKEKYQLIYNHWEEFEVPTSGWHCHQDFCTGNCEDCEVKNHCQSFKEWEADPGSFKFPYEPDKFHPGFVSEDESNKKPGNDSSQLKKEIKGIMNSIPDKDFIPSIHNYCDRWCDMCSFKSKCSAFYFEKELLKLAANDDPERSSLGSVKHVFSVTSDILEESLKENDSDIELPVTTDDSFFPKLPAGEQKVLDFAKEYVFSTSQWFDAMPEEKIIEKQELMGPVNVIMYYHIFISTKLARAFFGRIDYPDDDPIQNDSNGSAKVAIMAIKKSLESWTQILTYKKEDEEVILRQCVKLKKLKKMVERFFPHAHKFLRPGFDYLPD